MDILSFTNLFLTIFYPVDSVLSPTDVQDPGENLPQPGVGLEFGRFD